VYRGVLQRRGRQFPLFLYLGAIALLAALFTRSLLAQAQADGMPVAAPVPGYPRGAGRQSSGGGAGELAATLLATPWPLPRMDFSGGIPPEARTLVVTPTLLASAANVEDLVEALEVRFWPSGRQPALWPVDRFSGCGEETLPEDAALVRLARNGSRR